MKAILVIDMPNVCENCLLNIDGLCAVTREPIHSIGCPLKPMPEKMDEDEDVYNIRWFKYGFNTCVEVISNEQNDRDIQEKEEE